MTRNFKQSPIVALVIVSILLTAIDSNAGWFFGRKYDSSRDYSCCLNGQLYIHHFYQNRFFGFTTGSGYDLEPIGSPGSCDTECPPANLISTGM